MSRRAQGRLFRRRTGKRACEPSPSRLNNDCDTQQRNRLMQKLRAETCVRRKSGHLFSERNGRNESIAKEDCFLGTLSPDPWDFIAVDANPS